MFRNPTDDGGLFNLNWFEAIGKGAAITRGARRSRRDADARRPGTAPLEVHFDGTATDSDRAGRPLTYKWDFGVAGTNDDTSTEQDPTYTYAQRRHLQRDGHGDRRRRRPRAPPRSQVARDRAASQCPTNDRGRTSSTARARHQPLDGHRGRTTRVRRRSSSGSLNFPIDNGSIYQAGTSARNIIVQPLPERRLWR